MHCYAEIYEKEKIVLYYRKGKCKPNWNLKECPNKFKLLPPGSIEEGERAT